MALFYTELTLNSAGVSTPITALNAVTNEIGAERSQNVNENVFYVVGGTGITVGAFQVEEAHISGYSGTWAPVGSPVTVAASTIKTVKASGVGRFYRVRVSTLIDGTGITVFAAGR